MGLGESGSGAAKPLNQAKVNNEQQKGTSRAARASQIN
jgi:hypothetical protein